LRHHNGADGKHNEERNVAANLSKLPSSLISLFFPKPASEPHHAKEEAAKYDERTPLLHVVIIVFGANIDLTEPA